MKNFTLLLIFFFLAQFFYSQTSKTINLTTAGTLKDNISLSEQKTINNLTITGSIDVRDFVFMRDKIELLSVLDLTSSAIKSYSGTEGTYLGSTTVYPANEIPAYSFYDPLLLTYKSSLTSIKFPAATSRIGIQAFYYCWNLAGSVNIPTSLTSIASYAFYGCSAVESFTVASSNTRYSAANGVLFNKSQDSLFIVPQAKSGSYTIPTTVKYIGASSFYNCTNLTSILIPNTVTEIGSYAFSYCSGITAALTLPTTLKKIGDGAFYGCWNLTSVNIPAALTDIGYYCFIESNSVTSFNVNASNPNYTSVNGMLMSKNQDTLFSCPPAKVGAISIPTTTKLIGSYAFYNCSKITGIMTIPQNVDYIGYYAFYNCSLISSFEASTQNAYFTSENGILLSKAKDRLLVCPVSKSGTYQMPGTIKNIDLAAFAYCSNISGNMQLPASVSTIGEYAFYNCNQISTISVEAANTKFSSDMGVLYNHEMDTLLICPLAKTGTYTIPEKVRYIGYSAFDGCSKLTAISFPTTLTGIGSYAFEFCTGLTKIEIPKSTITIANGAFYSCTNLSEVSIANPNPPIVDYYTFDLVNKTSCKLIVPSGSTFTYASANYWKDFTQTSEQTFHNALKSNNMKPLYYTVSNKAITIIGLDLGESYSIYNTSGKLICSGKCESQQTIFRFINSGIYLLKTKVKCLKISI